MAYCNYAGVVLHHEEVESLRKRMLGRGILGVGEIDNSTAESDSALARLQLVNVNGVVFAPGPPCLRDGAQGRFDFGGSERFVLSAPGRGGGRAVFLVEGLN